MIIIFITILDVVVQCMGFQWCGQYSMISFQHLILGGLVELIVEIPVAWKGSTTLLRIYRRKSDKTNFDKKYREN